MYRFIRKPKITAPERRKIPDGFIGSGGCDAIKIDEGLVHASVNSFRVRN